jgi:GTP-binding protein
MELVWARRGKMLEMTHRGNYSYVVFSIPARGLIGLRTRVLNATQGEGIMHHRFEGYKPLEGEVPGRANGVLISMVTGKTVAFGLDGLQDRSDLFVGPGAEVYEGMIVGENARDSDLNVNIVKEKKLTNMRASSADDAIRLVPPRLLNLEQALEFIREDELVEVTPSSIRLRKKVLKANQR